jgi:competence protein ComEC
MAARIWIVLAGIAAGILFEPPEELTVAAAILALGACGLRRRLVVSIVATFVLATAGGALAAALHHNDGAELRAVAAAFPRCRLAGHVLEHLGGLGSLAAVDSMDCSEARRATVVISNLDLEPGATFSASGWLRPLGDEGFERARARTGADAELVVADLVPGPIEARSHRAAASFRNKLRASVGHLEDDEQGLILGMTVGDTSALPPATNDELRRAGLSHLLAVSGSNVAIVLGVVALTLRRCSLAVRVASSAAALAFYVLIVGPQPSVIRAGTMGAIALVALWRGTPTESLHVLGLALVILLLMRPGLLFSPGLHLSAAATAGIVLWAGRMADRCRRLPRPIALAFGATLAAQFAVAPILLVTFGELSLVAPIANVLAFPAVAPITIAGLAAGVSSLLSPTLAAGVMSLLSPLARWVVRVGEITGGEAWSAPETPRWLALPTGAVVLYAVVRTLRRAVDTSVAGSREDACMDAWRWKLLDADGRDLRTTEPFGSKEEAESWLGAEWQALAAEGAESVTLLEGDEVSYNMSLQEG